MDIPPKIPETAARIVPLEVVSPEPSPATQGQDQKSAHDGYPIHALSALILIAVDSLWAVFEWAPPLWLLTIPLCFIAVAVPVFLIQKYLKTDSTARALTFATLLGVLAAIPTPVTGTSVGLGVLAWSGVGRFLKRR